MVGDTPEMKEALRNYSLEEALRSGFLRRAMTHLNNGMVRDDLVKLIDDVRELSISWERIWEVVYAGIANKSANEQTPKIFGNIERATREYVRLKESESKVTSPADSGLISSEDIEYDPSIAPGYPSITLAYSDSLNALVRSAMDNERDSGDGY